MTRLGLLILVVWLFCMQGDRGRKGRAPSSTEGGKAGLEAGPLGRPDQPDEQIPGSLPEEATALPTIATYVSHLHNTEVMPIAPCHFGSHASAVIRVAWRSISRGPSTQLDSPIHDVCGSEIIWSALYLLSALAMPFCLCMQLSHL